MFEIELGPPRERVFPLFLSVFILLFGLVGSLQAASVENTGAETESSALPLLLKSNFVLSSPLALEGPNGEIILYSAARGRTSCAVALGWLVSLPDLVPLFYSLRHQAWVYVPDFDDEGSGLWLYDYASRDWFSYH